MTPECRYKVAIHEAGHAVVALHYGFTLRKRCAMVLHKRGEYGSVTRFTVPPGNRIHDAVAGMAGAAAAEISGQSFSETWDQSFDDMEAVERLVTRVRIGRPRSRSKAAWQEWRSRNAKADSVRMDAVFACRRQARAILKKRWPTVKAIAKALAERGRLDRDEVEAIYNA